MSGVSTCAATLAAAGPPMRGCKMIKNEPIATGKNANVPEKYDPIEWLAAVTSRTHSVTTADGEPVRDTGGLEEVKRGLVAAAEG